MIANPNYQLMVTENDLQEYATSVQASLNAIKGANRGKVLIIDEDDNTNTVISNMKRFSLYQYALNDKGKEVLIKHGGALPIKVSAVQNATAKNNTTGVAQYWKLSFNASTFTSCCENYSIRFGMYNDAIQKTMFPSEYVETFSTENVCCGRGCNNSDPFTADEIAFRIWLDVAYYNRESRGYVTAWMTNADGDVIADDGGNISFDYTSGGKSHTVTASVKDVNDGVVKYTDANTTDSTSASGEKSISDFVALMGLSSSNVNLIFGIAAEDENNYGQMNFKYDVIRNTVARVTLNGGFECANGITLINNGTSANGTAIKIDVAGTAAGSTDSVGQFAYAYGSGYDVQAMELADSLHTLNSPYTLSDVTLSENGIVYRAKKNSAYKMLTMEYNQPSDGVTRVEHHPWGTTIAILSTATTTEWAKLATLIGTSFA